MKIKKFLFGILVCVIILAIEKGANCESSPKWKVVTHFGLITTVCIDKNILPDKQQIAQILHYIENNYGKGAIWLFDDEKFTPRGVPMTDEQMLHEVGIYDPTQWKTFQYVIITDPNSSPPKQKLINTDIVPGYAG